MNFEALKPTREEIRSVALRETDPRHANDFEPIVHGPLVAIVILLFVGVVGVVSVPFRLLARTIRGSR